MKPKQTSENNIVKKLIANTIQLPVGTIAKLSNKKPPTLQKALAFEQKKPSDTTKQMLLINNS